MLRTCLPHSKQIIAVHRLRSEQGDNLDAASHLRYRTKAVTTRLFSRICPALAMPDRTDKSSSRGPEFPYPTTLIPVFSSPLMDGVHVATFHSFARNAHTRTRRKTMLTQTNARVARFTPATGFSATLQRLGRRAWSFTGSTRSSTKRLQPAVPVYVFISNPAPGQHERVVRALGDLLAEVGLELESSADG
jgi:hypothetical protein